MKDPPEQTRVALALGSGCARGFLHIGVIEALEERGHEIAGIAGTSMGAVVGGLYAAGQLDADTEWVRTLTPADVLRLLDPTLPAPGMVRAEKILARVTELVGSTTIEELPIPFTAVATDLGVAFAGVRRRLGGAMPCMALYAAAHVLLAVLPMAPALRGVAGAALALGVLLACVRLLRPPARTALLGIAPLPLLLDPGTVAAGGATFLFYALFLGPGEEILFRGYIQSRLNRAFGRPATLGGQRWGWALPLTASLFGGFHVLNLPDLYAGLWVPAWWAGLAGFGWGLFFGWLREWDGSVLAPAAVHGIPQGLAAAILSG